MKSTAEATAEQPGRKPKVFPKTGRLGLLAKIHIIKKDINLSELDYRGCLHEWTGLESCSDMTDEQLETVLRRLDDILDGLAAKSGSAPAPAPRKPQDDYPSGCSRPQWRKIRWLQKQLQWNDKNLRGYINHVTGLDHEKFLDVPTARRLIAGMVSVKAHAGRQARKQAANHAKASRQPGGQ